MISPGNILPAADNPSTVTFSIAPPAPAPATLSALPEFFRLLNAKFPIDRSLGDFKGNHSIILGEGGVNVNIWVWKQLDWRCFYVGLGDEDLALSPEGLVEEIVRVLQPELEKLIKP